MLNFFDNTINSVSMMKEAHFAFTGHYDIFAPRHTQLESADYYDPAPKELTQEEKTIEIDSYLNETKQVPTIDSYRPSLLAEKIKERRDRHIQEIEETYPTNLRSYAIDQVMNRQVTCADKATEIIERIRYSRARRGLAY